ncbi:MAG: deoxyribose-phosphate aldolase [Oscillospiraceae bacterium]|nr:deoxyribose-phosphate aldolase [Oscillospiraceae bacterium]
MKNSEIFPFIDHTLLRATATAEQIRRLCEEACAFGTASVCIPASYVNQVRGEFPELKICTVIGFPLGYSTTEVKCFEARDAVQNGADEIDMVINIGWAKDGRFPEITKEIAEVKRACGGKLLKVIIETCYLTDEEKIALCGCVTEAGADFIKTSTGFGSAGATLEDIRLFKDHIGENVKIKAAGGIKTKADIEEFLKEGCGRIGTSSAASISVEEE